MVTHHEITLKFSIFLNFPPESCLLHLFIDLDRIEMSLLNNLLLAAKMLIAKNWKTQIVPTIHAWHMKCHYVLLMNKQSAMKSVINGSNMAMRVFSVLWSNLVIYWKTQYPMNNFLQPVLEIY